MPRLFSAQRGIKTAHGFAHIAVAHSGAFQSAAALLHEYLQSHVAHHRTNQHVVMQCTVAHHVISAQGHNLISIENAALFIRHDKPIRVAVQGQPDIRANLPHSGLHGLGIQRPALIVYIQTVRLRAKPENLRAKLFRARGATL